MFTARVQLGLPLLARELTEQAKRGRTYGLRTLYACLLFGLAYVRFHDILRLDGGSGFAILGQGRRMFDELVGLQLAGIYLFMPALGCSAITSEKERNTLTLLFLTRLGPWTILFEKLLSRLAPMFVCLLLATPLLAFTYSLGGVTQLQFWGSIWILGLTTMQVASVTIMFSAFCTATVAAFIGSYAGTLATLLVCGCCSLPAAYGGGGVSVQNAVQLAVHTVGLLLSTVLFLVLARNYLTSRADVERPASLRWSLHQLDRFRVRVSEATGEIMLVRHSQALPSNEPVAWRATAKSSLASTSYLTRIVASVEIPLLLVLPIAIAGGGSAGRTFATFLLGLLWLVSVLLLIVKTSGLIHDERARGTLETLLTTPMTGAEILLQKLRGFRRLLVAMGIPFGTILLARLWFAASAGLRAEALVYLLCFVLSVLIYLPLVVWLTLFISLQVNSQGRAILLSVVVFAAWILWPVLIPAEAGANIAQATPDVVKTYRDIFVCLLSPSVAVVRNEIGTLSRTFSQSATGGVMFVILNFALYGGLLWIIRGSVLWRADALLGRVEGEQKQGASLRPDALTRSVGWRQG